MVLWYFISNYIYIRIRNGCEFVHLNKFQLQIYVKFDFLCMCGWKALLYNHAGRADGKDNKKGEKKMNTNSPMRGFHSYINGIS